MVELTAGRPGPAAEATVFRLRPGRIAAFLWTASFLVIALGLFREWYVTVFGFETIAEDMRHLALNAEYCLPAWYTSLILALSGGLLAMVTASAARHGENYLFHWAILAVMFVGLSIDESTGVHELAIDPLQSGLGLSGFFHFA